jgi:hypothetical protein
VQPLADTLVHSFGLVSGHAYRPVRTSKLASFGNCRMAAHTYPYHGQSLEGRLQASLRVPTIEENVVDDDTRAGVSDGRQTLVPRC